VASEAVERLMSRNNGREGSGGGSFSELVNFLQREKKRGVEK